MSYNPISGGGDVSKVGTPVNNQVGVWTGDGTLEGDANITYDGSELNIGSGDISVDATRFVYLDGSGNTSISESSDGVMSFVTNGFTRFSCSTATFQTNVEQVQFGDQGPANVNVQLNAASNQDSTISFNEAGSIGARFFRDQSADEFWCENSAVRVWTANTNGELEVPAATTARASLNMAHGAAPTTPNDGDMWTTTAGLFVRINGVTVGPLS